MFPLRLPVLTPLLLAASFAPLIHAQSFCASDGQSQPVALVERFINADCRDCWADPATLRVRPRELVLDWVLPGSQGEDAPLSAVATRDGLKRLQALDTAPPAGSSSLRTTVAVGKGRLRVAHGLPVSGYIGASIAYKQVPADSVGQPWSAWLALVETIPIGTEGTPVPRHLVRNLIQPLWDGRNQLSKQEPLNFIESRSLDVPQGMDNSRVRVIGWVQDAQGRLVAAAQSRCAGN